MIVADAILQAVKNGDTRAVERLLQDNPAFVHAADEHRKTPLHWAAECDRLDIAGLLLDAGADIEARTSWGATPFDWAAHLGNTGIADMLLARGAQGMNLVAAASLGKLDTVRGYLESKSPPGRRPAPDHPNDHWVADSACMSGDVISDAFWGACRNGHTAVAALLLERGAEIDAKGVFGGTALHWAAINGHGDTVEFLIARGASAALRDAKFDSTPAQWAAEGGHGEIRDLLQRE